MLVLLCFARPLSFFLSFLLLFHLFELFELFSFLLVAPCEVIHGKFSDDDVYGRRGGEGPGQAFLLAGSAIGVLFYCYYLRAGGTRTL